jgi:hypothetical protein
VVIQHVEVNGEPVESVGVELLRTTTYGHFTSMQVRDGRVRRVRADRGLPRSGPPGHGDRPDHTDSHATAAAGRRARARGTAPRAHRQVPLVYIGEQAKPAGYDDAIFLDRAGYVFEATIWDVCFPAGDRIVWPQAAVLPGITMRTLQQGWRRPASRPVTAGPARRTRLLRGRPPDELHRSALPIASITTPSDTVTHGAHPASAAVIAAASATVSLDEI